MVFQIIKKYVIITCPEAATKFAPDQLRTTLKKSTETGKLIELRTDKVRCTSVKQQLLNIKKWLAR